MTSSINFTASMIKMVKVYLTRLWDINMFVEVTFCERQMQYAQGNVEIVDSTRKL